MLAGSALSAREIREMCVWLAGENQDDIVAVVTSLRREELVEWLDAATVVAPATTNAGSSKADSLGDLTAELALVLRTESHLTAREAATRLAAELEKERRRGPDVDVAPGIPVYSKESFRAYVGKLLKHTSPQMLLHLAHRIRDSIVDRQMSAWPLRGRTG